MPDASYPTDVRYTVEHEWARLTGDVVRIGITSYAQEALGDIVFLQLPAVGTAVTAGQALGEVESTKSVSDVYAPLAGTVVARNELLDGAPETVNSDPFGEGWLVEIQVADTNGYEAMLDAAAYAAHLADH